LDWNEVAEKVKRHKHGKMTELVALMVDSVSVGEYLKKHGWADLKELAWRLAEEMSGKAFEGLEKLKELEPGEVEASYFLVLDNKILIKRKGEVKEFKYKSPRDLLVLLDVLKERSFTYMPERKLERLLREHPLVYRAYLTAATRRTVTNLYTIIRKKFGSESSLKVLAQKLGLEVKEDKDYLKVLEEVARRAYGPRGEE
jgi:hypothetical protein